VSTAMDFSCKKVVGILVEYNYEDLEVWYPLLRFKEEGYDVFTIGPEEGKVYQSKKQYPCKADKCIDSIKAEVIYKLLHLSYLPAFYSNYLIIYCRILMLW
jgi:putative intracellular protease/amidase